MFSPQNLIGTHVPLPHQGPDSVGVVLSQSWSEALGQILRVADSRDSTRVQVLYGDQLAAVLLSLGMVAAG